MYETFKRENFISSSVHESITLRYILYLPYCKQISDYQAFRSTQQSNISLFIVTIVVALCQTGGSKPKLHGGAVASSAPT